MNLGARRECAAGPHADDPVAANDEVRIAGHFTAGVDHVRPKHPDGDGLVGWSLPARHATDQDSHRPAGGLIVPTFG